MRIFAFDVGTTSVGFAVADYDETAQTGSIIRMGTRIFPEGTTEKKKEPRNQARRKARLARRQLRRRRVRKLELSQVLAQEGLLPAFGGDEWRRVMAADPYVLRAKGLTEKLEPLEVGRALYHVAKRRGFKFPSVPEEPEDPDVEQKGKMAKDDDDDPGIVKGKIETLRMAMGTLTVGAHLARQDKKRGHHTGRDMIRSEFERLWEAQAQHHRERMTATLRQTVIDIVFNQRPTFWRLKTLGRCRLLPGEELCPKGSWIGQQYTLLCDLNSLRIAGMDERELKAKGLQYLQGVAKGSYSALKKAMGLRSVRFNYEVSGGKKDLPGNATEAGLRKVFGDAWERHPSQEAIRREIFGRLWTVRYQKIGNARVEIRPDHDIKAAHELFIEEVRKDWGVTLEQATNLADLPLPTGWLRHSTAAIERMLPHLLDGHVYSEAVNRAFPEQAAAKAAPLDKLPTRSEQLPDWRNPTVTRALTEVRKVVNNLLAVHGKPDLIRIELARDLKLPKKQKLKMIENQGKLEKRHEEARKDLTEKQINPNGENRRRWILWKECGETSPYTGNKISFDALFRRGEFQIDHIHPESRTLNSNFDNLTLCEEEINRDKGNRTPFEYYRNRPQDWQRILNTLQSIKFPDNKLRRFLREDVDELGSEELVERQLRDTSYIAREARAFLEKLGVPVQTSNGRVTAQLRRMWGLETILSPGGGGKNREDHRHHAVDAAAIAFSSPAFIKRLSEYYALERQAAPERFPMPWRSFREDVATAVEKIVVSHRTRRKVSGSLHEATALGDTGRESIERGTTYRFFGKRVSLAAGKNEPGITPSQIGDIVDPEIRRIVKEHVATHGETPKKAFPPFPRLGEGGNSREIQKVRIEIKQQMALMAPVRPGRKTYAKLGDNHHMEIFRTLDGGTLFRIVSRFEAAKRNAAGKPVVDRSDAAGGKFLMSLAPGDTLEFPNPGGAPDYRVVTSVWANGQIVLVDHRSAADTVWKHPTAASLLEAGARKVAVDPIGRVRKARD
jgi:CRISPR-associated endonuclease Csn1